MNKLIVLQATFLILFCGAASSSGQQAVPEEAKRHFDRGVAAVEMAKSPDDYASAIKEFEQAASLAPDWPDVYYNLGIVQEKAEKYSDAITSLQQYLRLAPNASDAEAVKTLINRLKYKAEQPAEPPSAAAPTTSGPSLAETMKFIQDKLNGMGKVYFVVHVQYSDGGYHDRRVSEYSNVIADQNQCLISYHEESWSNDRQMPDENWVFSLRDVQEIVVKPEEQASNEGRAGEGVVSISPPVTRLEARCPHGHRYKFVFADADLADRVAKAMLHAVKLCGGGSKPEPF